MQLFFVFVSGASEIAILVLDMLFIATLLYAANQNWFGGAGIEKLVQCIIVWNPRNVVRDLRATPPLPF